MKHYFVVNPAAGTVDSTARVKEALAPFEGKLDYEIYVTKAPGDATFFVKNVLDGADGEECRFYACGGDGTLSEVASGLVGKENASLACFPIGSGNDFVKYYGGKDKFLNLEALLSGTEEKIDLIRIGDRYSINVTNFGFDTTVAKTMIRVKHKKVIGGSNAYKTGVFTAIMTSMHNKCRVIADGIEMNPEGKMLLCTLANGNYVGGSFKCAPRSNNADGLIDVCVIKPMPLFRFLSILPVYTAGKHLEDPSFADKVFYKQAKSVEIIAPEGFSISLDGEIVNTNHFTAEIVPSALRFVVPC